MKIEVSRTIDLPEGLLCTHPKKGDCPVLAELKGNYPEMRLCAYFNEIVFCGDNSTFFVRCDECIRASLKHFRRIERRKEAAK